MRWLPASLALSLIASGAAPAQPRDAAPPPGAEPVIIFFAWDAPVIDSDAAARLNAVAAAYRRSPDVRLELAGHADRSGPASANRQSGQRRAQAVAAYLVARGVPATMMVMASYGETRPLIATADGVREPQNRRVEIAMTRTPAS